MPVLTSPSSPTHELPGTRFTSLATPSRGTVDTSVWRVEIAPGTEPVPHEVTREEMFVIQSGSAAVRLGDERHRAAAGDVVVVPADTLFEIANAGDEPLRALVCIPVGGQARGADGVAFTPPWAE